MERQVLVVGAGLSGLIAARELQKNGISTVVVDKGTGVGGRLATRHIAGGVADHGAQFFTARTNIFKAEIEEWLAEDLVRVWGYGWSDGSLKRTVSDGHPRYVTNGGMNNLAKHLAKEVQDIEVDVRVTDIKWIDDEWQVKATNDGVYHCQALLMTPPVPQSLELLSKVNIAPEDRSALQRIQYGPCICGIHVIDGEVNLPEPGAVQNFVEPVYWIANNEAKGITDKTILTAHASSNWSRNNFDMPDEAVLGFIHEAIQPYLGPGATYVEEQIKRWRYSVPLITHPRDTLIARGLPLVFAGDAFGGRGRIEGAYMSGLEAAKAVGEMFT
ncbi:MAG: FAD-dependent oxidoreductase [Anaerolineaceae bacterium]|nr:FAD-dependent oxidoreductase [Anaerolineaceae bacterium]